MPAHLSRAATNGDVSNRAATPAVPAISMLANPTGTPNTCGSAARKPWFAPVTVAIMLLGPGVKEPTNARITKASS